MKQNRKNIYGLSCDLLLCLIVMLLATSLLGYNLTSFYKIIALALLYIFSLIICCYHNNEIMVFRKFFILSYSFLAILSVLYILFLSHINNSFIEYLMFTGFASSVFFVPGFFRSIAYIITNIIRVNFIFNFFKAFALLQAELAWQIYDTIQSIKYVPYGQSYIVNLKKCVNLNSYLGVISKFIDMGIQAAMVSIHREYDPQINCVKQLFKTSERILMASVCGGLFCVIMI